MPDPGADLYPGITGEDVAPDALGHGGAVVVGEHQRIEGEGVVADQSGHEGSPRGAYDDFGLVGIPARRQPDGHQGSHLIGSSRDPAPTEHQSYPAHTHTLNRFPVISSLFTRSTPAVARRHQETPPAGVVVMSMRGGQPKD